MHRTFTLLTIAAFALSLAGSADAASSCRDSKGKYVKCPAASASTAAPAKSASSATSAAKPASATAMASSSSGPNCKKGKRCGNACISVNDVCHK
jgi:hypothetical protein